MPDVLVRDLDSPALTRLKRRAKRNHRSLQAELRLILIEASDPEEVSFEDAVRFADEMRRKYAGKVTGDSTEIIREYRDR
jgi:plasmid stability protein